MSNKSDGSSKIRGGREGTVIAAPAVGGGRGRRPNTKKGSFTVVRGRSAEIAVGSRSRRDSSSNQREQIIPTHQRSKSLRNNKKRNKRDTGDVIRSPH